MNCSGKLYSNVENLRFVFNNLVVCFPPNLNFATGTRSTYIHRSRHLCLVAEIYISQYNFYVCEKIPENLRNRMNLRIDGLL